MIATDGSAMTEANGKPRILIIDSDEDFREMIRLYLALEGYSPSAVDAVDAVVRVRSDPPELIVAEWTSPLLDGPRFLKWLREEAGYDRPVLVLTALKRADIESRAIAAGADAVLFKPAGPAAIAARISELIQ